MAVGISKKKLFGGTLLERLQVSQHTVLLGMALIVGSLTGLGAVIFIRRGKQLVFPHGDTVLQEGDIITALVEQSYEGGVREGLS